jgi:hypothetical protein
LHGEKIALITGNAQNCAFTRRINEELMIPAKWLIQKPSFAETVSGVFRNVRAARSKNL